MPVLYCLFIVLDPRSGVLIVYEATGQQMWAPENIIRPVQASRWKEGDRIEVRRPADNQWTLSSVHAVGPMNGVLISYQDTGQQMWVPETDIRASQANVVVESTSQNKPIDFNKISDADYNRCDNNYGVGSPEYGDCLHKSMRNSSDNINGSSQQGYQDQASAQGQSSYSQPQGKPLTPSLQPIRFVIPVGWKQDYDDSFDLAYSNPEENIQISFKFTNTNSVIAEFQKLYASIQIEVRTLTTSGNAKNIELAGMPVEAPKI